MADNDGLITFTDGEVKSGYLVQEPAWYRLKTLSFRKMTSQKGDSTNYFVEVRGLNKELLDVEFTHMFNTHKGFIGSIVRYFEACNGGEKLASGKPYDFNATMGIEVEGYVQRGADKNGQPINTVADWRPIRTE